MSLTLNDCTRCVWSPSAATVIDFINPLTGRTVHYNNTLEEVRARKGILGDSYADAEEGEYDDIAPRLEAARRAKYVTKPEPCTAEQYEEALCCLPPMKWRGGGGASTFMMCEFYTADLTQIYCKIGDRFWSFRDTCKLGHDEIVRMCLEAKP